MRLGQVFGIVRLVAVIVLDPRPAWSPRRHAGRWAVATLVVTAVGVVCGGVVLASATDAVPGIRDGIVSSLCYLVPYGLVGAVLVSRRPDLPFGWLLSAATAALTVSVLASGSALVALGSGTPGPWAAWALGLGSLQFTSVAVQGLVNVRFPSGRVESRWGRVLDRLMIVGLALVTLGGVLRAAAGETAAGQLAGALDVAAPALVLVGILAGLRIVVRAARAVGVERQQLRWRAFGVLLSLLLFPFAVAEMLPSLVGFLDGAVFVTTLAIPVVWHHLWEIDTVVRRSTAYVLVTVVLAIAYLAVAAVGAALVSERVGVVVAALTVVLALGPARAGSQRLVDRLFYGRRGDPYQAVRDVSRRLEAVEGPGEVLAAVVDAMAGSLRLPYVAIEGPAGGVPLAVHGSRSDGPLERWPLTYQGVAVGALVAAPRPGEQAFDDRDREVLRDLARQSGPAVHAEALTADLVESRQRLVTAREEERRFLRRDLHDGLGPMLTALGLNLDAARARLAPAVADLEAGARLTDVDLYLTRAKETSSQAIVDLRSMVQGLRPPALDDLGLVGAVRVYGQRLSEGGATTVVVEATHLGDLPAAVEVAAFRIAVEAATNAVRHSGATTCRVRFDADADRLLIVDVTDDGVAGAPWSGGVGLQAMRERAAEVGGSVTAAPTPAGGQVHAWLPLATVARAGARP